MSNHDVKGRNAHIHPKASGCITALVIWIINTYVLLCWVVLGIAIRLATIFGAAYDAAVLRVSEYKVKSNRPLLQTFAGCFFLWEIYFPRYLINRKRILSGLIEKYSPEEAAENAKKANRRAIPLFIGGGAIWIIIMYILYIINH